jgi:hypothetical protein
VSHQSADVLYVTHAGTTAPFWWGSAITAAHAHYDATLGPYLGGGSTGESRKLPLAEVSRPQALRCLRTQDR